MWCRVSRLASCHYTATIPFAPKLANAQDHAGPRGGTKASFRHGLPNLRRDAPPTLLFFNISPLVVLECMNTPITSSFSSRRRGHNMHTRTVSPSPDTQLPFSAKSISISLGSRSSFGILSNKYQTAAVHPSRSTVEMQLSMLWNAEKSRNVL
jgi:hypothetical protein